MASKVKHESKAARTALQAAIVATSKALETADKAHARMVHELGGLMAGGLSVQAVKAEIGTTGADKALSFRVSYAQFLPLMADSLKLSGAPSVIFGSEGMASLFARANQAWKRAGGESFASEVKAKVASASSWSEVESALSDAINKAKQAQPAKPAKPAKPASGGSIDDLEPEALSDVLTLSAVATYLTHLDATGYKASAHELGTLRNIATVARKLSAK